MILFQSSFVEFESNIRIINYTFPVINSSGPPVHELRSRGTHPVKIA